MVLDLSRTSPLRTKRRTRTAESYELVNRNRNRPRHPRRSLQRTRRWSRHKLCRHKSRVLSERPRRARADDVTPIVIPIVTLASPSTRHRRDTSQAKMSCLPRPDRRQLRRLPGRARRREPREGRTATRGRDASQRSGRHCPLRSGRASGWPRSFRRA